MFRRLPLASLIILFSLRSTDAMGQRDADMIMADAWTLRETLPILDKTLRVRLPFAGDALEPGERAAVEELIAAGERLHDLYLAQLHPEALPAKAALLAHPERPDLAELFRIMNGPVSTTLDNQRVAFLAVAPESPARNVYPAGATRDSIDAYLAAHPERRDELMDLRSVLEAATPTNVRRALTALDAHPVLDVLHSGLRERIARAESYLAIPYSIAYADDILYVYDRLNAAATHLDSVDPAFAKFLRQRGRDLLADDYDGSDATWVTAEFTGNLNAEIGSYETYDDPLYGVRTFFALSLLQRDTARSAELAAAIGDIQDIEDALPNASHKKVSSRIPVGVYNVIADFGQALEGPNTATILPNESHLARQYGRTILIRGNILMNPELFALSDGDFDAATVDAHHADLDPEGPFYRTLWHEVGHYLGVDRTADGRELDAALQDTADLLEEMKADLVSLFVARLLHARGLHDDTRLRAIYADGIARVLQRNRPRREQPYQTMQLIQWNWFLDRGLLTVEGGRLKINYDRYPDAVDSLLAAVFDLQRNGDRAAAKAFVDRWTNWDESLHGVIAKRMRDAETTRFVLVQYEALGE